MATSRLLAKSYDRKQWPDVPPPFALLTQHSRDVAEAALALVDRFGTAALANAGLPSSMFSRLRQSVVLNAWVQDLGKANDHYRAMVDGNPEQTQLLRHETISGLITTLEGFRTWFQAIDPEVFYPALWGAMGHHRKFSDRHWRPKDASPTRVHLDHKDFKAIWTEMVRDLLKVGITLAKDTPPSVGRTIGSGRGVACDIHAAKAVAGLLDECELWSDERDNPEFRRYVALVKAIGIAADVCASAVAQSKHAARGGSMSSFVRENLSIGLTSANLDELAWRWAWENATQIKEKPNSPESFPPDFVRYPFQEAVADSESLLTLAEAGCGSGKSLAAYLWAGRWCQKWEEEGRTGFRLIFTLPTTGTTTEHFKDYALNCGVPEDLVSLTHSRSSVDLEFMAETAPQEEGDDEAAKPDPGEQAKRMLAARQDKIESLALWGTPLIVSTTDTVLGLMGNARKSVYSFPALMQSAIVFDEIHAYDEDLFGHLLVFLENFRQVPVLLMTASLPEARRQAIEKIRPDLKRVPGPPELEGYPRYATPLILPEAEVWREVEDCLKGPNPGKVLWVRNQVGWANKTFLRCREQFKDLKPWVRVYHSRFRYKDRVRVHREVVDRFRKGQPGGAILCATQVAEMSLNLSADLLVTDYASIPALIQRYGRLARDASPKTPRPLGRSIVCEPPLSEKTGEPDHLPYESTDLHQARQWLQELIKLSSPLKQCHLNTVFAGFGAGKTVDLRTARQRAVFFSGLWQTYPASVRAEGHTLAVVLQEDVEKYPKGRLTDFKFLADWLRKYEVSIPIHAAMRQWETSGHTPIAPSDSVSYKFDENDPASEERTGASWR
jgi:CRISPR-associated endonuclease/helicase Cas3